MYGHDYDDVSINTTVYGYIADLSLWFVFEDNFW